MSLRGLIIGVWATVCVSVLPAAADSYVLIVNDRSSNVSLMSFGPIIEAPPNLKLPGELKLRFALDSKSPDKFSLVSEDDDLDLERILLNDVLGIGVRPDSSVEESFVTVRVYTIEESFGLSANELSVKTARLVVSGQQYTWQTLFDSASTVSTTTHDDPPVDEYIPVQKEVEFDYGRLASLVHYPDIARRQDIQGQVLVAALVNEEGIVDKAMILESANAVLQPYAMRAVVLTEYTPAYSNGKPVKTWVRIPVLFKLR